MYFITRRTERRELRLLGAVMAAAFAVFWALAGRRSGVRSACLAALSNHYHAVVWDPEGRLADFLRDVNGGVARFGNALQRVARRFWDGQQTFVEELVDADAVIAKMAYVMANPVLHRLVAKPEQWQGLLTRVDEIGGCGPRYERPDVFFADDGTVDDEVELVSFVPPMCVAAYGIAGFKARLRAAIEALVASAQAEAVADGRGFVGMEAVLEQSPLDAPTTPSGRSAGRKAKAGKRVAGSEPEGVRALRERDERFRTEHQSALEQFRAGLREVLFPAGTWFAWRFFGAKRKTLEPGCLAAA